MTAEKSIHVTPRAASYLAAIKVTLDQNRADAQKAAERRKEERLRAVAESREPGHHFHPCPCPTSPELSEDEIAARALEEGAAQLLNVLTNRHPPMVSSYRDPFGEDYGHAITVAP